MIDIDVSKALKQPGEQFAFKYSGIPDMPGIEFAGPLAVNAEYSVTGSGVRVFGWLRAVIATECTRCLGNIDFAIGHQFDELFEKAGGSKAERSNAAGRQDAHQEAAYDSETGETVEGNYTFTGETLGLDKLVYDAIMLDIPPKLLCSEHCKGLCQKCGANLNETDCGCDLDDGVDESNPFAKLKNLFDESDSE